MKRIHKVAFPKHSLNSKLDSQWEFRIEMPLDAKIIHVACKNNWPQIWYETDPDEIYTGTKTEERLFYSVGTGHGAVPENASYLTTIDIGFVWHIYATRVS